MNGRRIGLLGLWLGMTSCQQVPSGPYQPQTPLGPLVVEWSVRDLERTPLRVTAETVPSSPPSPRQRRREIGFFPGATTGQHLLSRLSIHAGAKTLAVPQHLTSDLWNLDLAGAGVSLVYQIRGYTGYKLHGSEGERAYSVVFFFDPQRRGVGRLVQTGTQVWFEDLTGRRTSYPKLISRR